MGITTPLPIVGLDPILQPLVVLLVHRVAQATASATLQGKLSNPLRPSLSPRSPPSPQQHAHRTPRIQLTLKTVSTLPVVEYDSLQVFMEANLMQIVEAMALPTACAVNPL
jgi:hypothetical protein